MDAEGSSDGRTPLRRAAAGVPAATVRAWAWEQGIAVSRTGGLPRFVYDMYRAAQGLHDADPSMPDREAERIEPPT